MRKKIQNALGTELTPLQAKIFLAILEDKVISVNGLLKKGFSEKTIRYLFRKWKSLEIITPMAAGLYRLNNNISKQITPEIKKEIEKIAENYDPNKRRKNKLF